MESQSLSLCQQRVDAWIKSVGVRYFSELTNTAILMEEVGELARIMARRYGDQSNKPGEETLDPGDEMADILFVVFCLANQCNIDLDVAFDEAMQKKSSRDAERHRDNPKLNS